uniref:Uncharacterized protein n=1 Tax=Nelumbo nucifera TaxID=4432 RepID=A0A822ZSU3_NELNU|nr:TPA_asm: hypothetical protein HUJ06_018921 [Nelumbo nucifera]
MQPRKPTMKSCRTRTEKEFYWWDRSNRIPMENFANFPFMIPASAALYLTFFL